MPSLASYLDATLYRDALRSSREKNVATRHLYETGEMLLSRNNPLRWIERLQPGKYLHGPRLDQFNRPVDSNTSDPKRPREIAESHEMEPVSKRQKVLLPLLPDDSEGELDDEAMNYPQKLTSSVAVLDYVSRKEFDAHVVSCFCLPYPFLTHTDDIRISLRLG